MGLQEGCGGQQGSRGGLNVVVPDPEGCEGNRRLWGLHRFCGKGAQEGLLEVVVVTGEDCGGDTVVVEWRGQESTAR